MRIAPVAGDGSIDDGFVAPPAIVMSSAQANVYHLPGDSGRIQAPFSSVPPPAVTACSH